MINQNKQGYKHTPLGWIPNEWQVKELGEIGKLSSGTTPLRQRQEDFYLNGTIPWVKTTDLNNSFIVNTEESVTEKALFETSLRKYPIGTILIAMYGGYNQIGRTGLIKISATVNQALTAIQLFDNYEPKYILECLNHRVGYWKNFAGSSRKDPNITSKDVFDFPIIIAPLNEQLKITKVLSIWDETITKTLELIVQLQKRNKGLMQQLLKPKKNWKEYYIGNVLKEVKRPVNWNNEELYHLISVRRRSGGAFFRESLYGNQILTKSLFTTVEGDFLFSKMQIVHGASAVVPQELAGMKISGSYIAVHATDKSILDINFFNWVSKTPWFYYLTYISSYGVHIEKMTFDFNDFKRRKIKLPSSVDEQKKIVQILQTASEEVMLLQNKLASLQQQKKGLMQKLLTGEVRVI
jgi:type I restriction enzyme S subunit